MSIIWNGAARVTEEVCDESDRQVDLPPEGARRQYLQTRHVVNDLSCRLAAIGVGGFISAENAG